MVPTPPDAPGVGAPQTDGLDWVGFADALWLTAITTGGGGSMSSEHRDTVDADRQPAEHPPDDGPSKPESTAPSAKQQPAHPPVRPPPHRIATTTEGTGIDRTLAVAVPVLPGSRNIARALKPFKRRVPSLTETEPDEEATAERAADEGLWLPASRPAQARWLALVFIFDDSPSMAAWRPTVTAFRLLLERHGCFRNVREFILSTAPDENGHQCPRIRGPGTGPRNPAELLDPSGRQIFLVFTDGIGALWRDPETGRMLRLWASSGPLGIINPYPQGYWHRTNTWPRRAQLYASHAVTPNDKLGVRYPDELSNPFDQPVEGRALPIPILALSARWIRWWAGLVTDPFGWVDALVWLVDPVAPAENEEPAPVEAESPRELVLRFRSSASPMAFRLATYFAAAPLDLPLLRKLQRVMLPDSAPFHLAEVVTSDLVRPTDGPAPSLEFTDGVRETLLACGTRDESARVVRAIAVHYNRRDPTALALSRAIEAPDQAPEPPVTKDNLPMARIELAVLNALSGPYARRAHRLRRSIEAVEHQSEPSTHDHEKRPYGQIEIAEVAREDGIGEDMPTQWDPDRSADDERDPVGRPFLDDEDPLLSVQALLDGQDNETGPTVWGNVPPRNPVFTGRRELLAELEQRLRTESVAAVLPQALHGMGGVGKSQIAIEYAYRHRAEYDVIWWVPSEQPAQILASLIELGGRLGLDVGMEANTAVPRVRAALRAGAPYGNWLLIFDNAETLETVRDYFPESGTGKVLVTSRNPEWTQIADTLEVDVFTRPESIRLLHRWNSQLSDDDADRLAEALGDIPLAIEHASAWLHTTGMAVGEYLSLLAQKRTELEVIVPAPGYEMPVAAAANVALDRLGVENPAALQLLQVCSFFAPEPIERELFTGPRITPIAPELDEALQNPSRLNQAIRDIQRYVLIRIDHRANTIQLHRLVQAVLQGRMPTEQRAKVEHGAHVLLAGGSPGNPSNTGQWLRYQSLASHLTASNAITCEDDWARELILNLIAFYYHWGDYGSCQDLAQRVVDQWRGMLGADHRQTLKAAKWLGFVWWVQGEFAKAAAINADCLERYQRTVGPDDDGTIDAMALVAANLRAGGRFNEARQLDLDAFQRARRVFGEDDPYTLRTAHNLGISLRLNGDFRTARQLDSDTYRRKVAILGVDHADTLLTLNSLTLDERECGEYVKARQLAERLYQRHVDLLGVPHPATIRVARNLAVARRRAGDHDGAYKLAEDTMNRFLDRFGPTHPDTIATTLNFAVDAREADDLPRAYRLATEAAERYQATLGSEHPYTLYARTNLGIVLRLQGEFNEAHRHNFVAWETLERLLGPNHLLTLTCAINLSSDRAAMGDHQGAYALDTDALRRCREVIGAEHPTTLANALNLAFDLSALGRSDESTALLNRTLNEYGRVLGNEHPAINAATARVRANCDVDPMPL